MNWCGLAEIYAVTVGVGFAAGLGWHAAKALWPYIHPWFGYSQGRYFLILGMHVICRVPFAKKLKS